MQMSSINVDDWCTWKLGLSSTDKAESCGATNKKQRNAPHNSVSFIDKEDFRIKDATSGHFTSLQNI